MSIQLKLRRGTTAQHSTFTGASGEVTVDTDKKTLVVHDGATAGGVPLATEAALSSGLASKQAALGFTPVNKAGDSLSGALNEAQGADIASATSINLTSATGNYVNVTGTTAITSITLAQGAERTVKFAAALTLTNGASLILPSGANITTAAGDVAVFRGEAAGVVRCVSYTKANGQPIASSSSYVGAGGQIFTANGTFTIPAGVTAVKVTVVGGGGAGGGAPTANNAYAPFGGAAGGHAIKYLTGLTPGATLAVTVGLGGTGVSAGNGNSGGTSSVASGTQTISTISATGGSGGTGNIMIGGTYYGPVAGGSGSGGDLNMVGGAGGMGYFLSSGCTQNQHFGGSGGAVGASAPNITQNSIGFISRQPALPGLFGGSGGNGASLTNTGSGGGLNGNAATGYGNGGQGAVKLGNSTAYAGGAGAAGVVIFEW